MDMIDTPPDPGFPRLEDRRDEQYVPRMMPRAIAEEAYVEYRRRYGERQTLDRIGERGGFALSEIRVLRAGPYANGKPVGW